MTFKHHAFPVMMFLGLAAVSALAQVNQGRGGRGGIPNATPEQSAAIAEMNTGLAPQIQKLAAARTGLVAAELAQPRNDAAIKNNIDAIRMAGFCIANF